MQGLIRGVFNKSGYASALADRWETVAVKMENKLWRIN